MKLFPFKKRIIKSFLIKSIYNVFLFLPLQKNKVLFASDSREEMSGNFLFVYKEMCRRNLDLDYYFFLKSSKRSYTELIKLTYHLATSKYIFLDDYYPIVYPLKIRKDAELIQLWHAVGAFKKFGYSRTERCEDSQLNSKDHLNYTKAIVSSKNVINFYAEGFGIKKEKIIPTGIPRTDIFFCEDYKKNKRQDLYKQYPFLKEKKVITFAPTFRGLGKRNAYYPSDILDLSELYNHLHDDYVLILKIHPFVKEKFKIPEEFKEFVYDFSNYREINDLLFVTDILITDYSSVCFEFSLLNKPMIFFAFDLEEYIAERDFYYNYSSFIPGVLTRSTEEIIKVIKSGNFDLQKIKPFVEHFYDHRDGNSSKRVVEQLILKNINC